MGHPVQVCLFGSLRELFQDRAESIHLHCSEPLPLREVLQRLGLGISCIQLAMANHKALGLGEMVRPGDRLALFPKEYAIFVDWKDFRT